MGLWLDIKNLQLCKTINLDNIREVFDVKYAMEIYDDKPKYKVKDKSCEKITGYLIMGFTKYNI